MLQKNLRSAALSTMGATWVRFLYGAPIILVVFAIVVWITGLPVPPMPVAFWMWAILGGAGQIIGTLCIVALFQHRNFAVGMTLMKTETLQTAILGLMLLGDTISAGGAAAIAIGVVAVVLLSKDPGGLDPTDKGRGADILNTSLLLGLGSGLALGFASIGYRGATLALGDGVVWIRSLTALSVVLTGQAIVLGAWIAWRDWAEVGRCLAAWRIGALVGVFSAAGSLGWFTAFALQNAAYVKALAQVELIFAALISRFRFNERMTGREIAGMVLLLLSAVVLILAV